MLKTPGDMEETQGMLWRRELRQLRIQGNSKSAQNRFIATVEALFKVSFI